MRKICHQLCMFNPLEYLDLIADAEKNFVMIMKDGAIHKNTIQ